MSRFSRTNRQHFGIFYISYRDQDPVTSEVTLGIVPFPERSRVGEHLVVKLVDGYILYGSFLGSLGLHSNIVNQHHVFILFLWTFSHPFLSKCNGLSGEEGHVRRVMTFSMGGTPPSSHFTQGLERDLVSSLGRITLDRNPVEGYGFRSSIMVSGSEV